MTKRSVSRMMVIVAAVALAAASGRCGQREERGEAGAGPVRRGVEGLAVDLPHRPFAAGQVGGCDPIVAALMDL